MTTQPQQQNPIQNNYYPDDEIELIDYLRVLWKWKWMIILITFVGMVAAGVFSFMMPQIYEVSTTIEPGIIGMNENGGPIYLDSSANIKAKIEAGIYNSQILKNLNIDPRKTELKFKAANPKNTNLINISSEWEQNKIAIGTKVLEQLLTELSCDYAEIIQAKKEDIDKQIVAMQNQIAETEMQRRKEIDKQISVKLSDIQGKKNQLKLQKGILKIIGERKDELIQETKQIKDATERTIEQRNRILEAKSGDAVSLLVYFSTVQQNMAYYNQLNKELYDLKTEEENIEAEIEKLNIGMNDINTEIERLKIQRTEVPRAEVDAIQAEIEGLSAQRSYIKNIKLVNGAKASTSPIKPKAKLNVALASVVGFMLAVFMAFFAEYIKKSKEEDRAKERTN